MYIVFMIWFLILFIVQLIYLIKSIRKHSSSYWHSFFSINLSSILSSILLFFYSLIFIEKIGINALINLFIILGSAGVYLLILLISIIFKVIEMIKQKANKSERKKIDDNEFKKFFTIPFLSIILISMGLYTIDYSVYVIKEKIEIHNYNKVKENKIESMVNFVNDKYDLNFTIEDSIFYREEDYSTHSGFLWSEDYNFPYTTVLKNNNQKITVVDRKGVLSDNGQLKEINDYIADYFSEIVGTKIDFVQIRETWRGGFESAIINRVLQHKFGNKITLQNIDKFMNELLLEDDLELIFYVKDSENRKELINNLIIKLSYLKEYKGIDEVKVYIYDKNEELIINHIEKDLVGDFKYENSGNNAYEDYSEFGYYFVPNKIEYYHDDEEVKVNNFVSMAYYNLNRGYTPGQGNRKYETINNWYVYTY